MTDAGRPTDGGIDVVADVVVAGGGIAGLATAVHVARLGHRVVCLEPASRPRATVGESLEFSAPDLIARLGVELGETEGSTHLYPKTAVRIVGDGDEFTIWPPRWFAGPPIWCSGRTFHTDRVELDGRVLDLALDAGVEVVRERVVRVDHDGDVVVAFVTDRGKSVRAPWFVDASGHRCQLLGRSLRLESDAFGPRRVACWARVPERPIGHETRLHFPDPAASELAWTWEIPLNAAEISIGVVMPATRFNRRRCAGLDPRAIFDEHVAQVPRLRRVAAARPDLAFCSTSFTPYRYRRPVGSNWLLVGDASAMVDPLTSNGVTSALRHAELGAALVSDGVRSGRITSRQVWSYRNTAPAAVAALDEAIESFVHRPEVRRRLGLRPAVTLYAATGVVTNALYAKIRPTTPLRSVACASVLVASRAWTLAPPAVSSRGFWDRSCAGESPPMVAELLGPPQNGVDMTESSDGADTARDLESPVDVAAASIVRNRRTVNRS